MINAEQIPDEAMNALLRALQLRKGGKEALAAALNAWPGVHKWDTGQVWHQAAIILPLLAENSNAEG